MNELPSYQSNIASGFVPTDITKLDFFREDSESAPSTQESGEPAKPEASKGKTKLNNYLYYLKRRSVQAPVLFILSLFLITLTVFQPLKEYINFAQKEELLSPLSNSKPGYEVFGFAPHWTFDKLDSVDFGTLTTMAYFGLEAKPDGNLDTTGPGYKVFMSDRATEVFKKAHKNGTRVVLTITQMDNENIKAVLDDPNIQESIINQTVGMVVDRGIDGVNIDFEYTGNPGTEYQEKFSAFARKLTDKVHTEIPGSKVTVSVYASAVKDPKLYNIKTLSEATDGIFMMAYDFAVAGSNNAIPTAPLYGHKEGKYWYDISTAVDAFLTQMSPNKLILGVPWYGYNYAVEAPEVKTTVNKGYYTYYKKGRRTYSQFVPLKSHAQTYTLVKRNVTSENSGISDYQEGFDEYGKVSWRAYREAGVWRMVFIDDVKSQAIKYDFAKEKGLGGVGMWALGFDDGPEVWALLKDKFGAKEFADSSVIEREIR